MSEDKIGWHGTTILSVRKGDKVVVAGDGQVSLGNTVIKPNARRCVVWATGRSSAASPVPPPMPLPCSSGWSAS